MKRGAGGRSDNRATMLPRYDITSLQIFVTVAECANLTRAAEREHLAVSAISKRIAELEAQARTPLLQRFARGVGLTPAGQSLLHHARTLLQVLRTMDAELVEYAGGIKGHVRLHAVASALTQFLPAEIESFLSRYPQVRLSMDERTSRGVLRAVGEGQADLGVVSSATALQGLTAFAYHHDRLVVGVPPGHALARRRRVSFEEVLEHDLVGPQPDSALARLLNDAARACGKPLRQRVQASSFEVMSRLVEARLGVTVLPQGTVERAVQAGRLRVVALRDAWAARELLLVVRDPQEMSPITRTLVEHLQRAAGTWRAEAAAPDGPAAG